MDRIALVAVVLVALGLWVHPSIMGRNRPALTHAAAAVVSGTSSESTERASPSPTWKTVRGRAGFWRVGQAQDGVWWFVSPTGESEFLNTVTTVQPYQLARDPGGVHYVSRDWDGGTADKGDLERWAALTLARVRETGFKGLGAWSNHVFHKLDVPITRDLNVWTWMAPADKRLYSPGWLPMAEHAVKVQVTPLRDNVNLVGYFIDNEIDWGDGFAGPAQYFNHLPPDDPNRREVVKVIRSLWADVDSFNKEWDTHIADWSELDAWQTMPHPPAGYGRLFSAWLGHLAEDYFRATTALIRKHDPNHLILGVRFRGYAPREVVRASREFTDVQSLNYYVSDGRLDAEMFRMMNEVSGQPVMITEYSFHALDGRSGNRNTVGFAAQVIDQQARADGYRQLTTRLARVPYVIGADWFQWHDEPPSGRSHDGEDVNFGVVDVDDHPYEPLAAAVRETTTILNSVHAGSASDDGRGVWREGFDQKPVARVPRLERAIRLNGELSDWPAAGQVQGVRHAQTIGLERSKVPVPKVFVGWREDGMYFGFEVFDNDIQGAPPKGWWWTRDHVEFWVSTRPVAPEQNDYNAYAHQFFFMPIDWPVEDGLMGQVGQWHRPGDAQKDHLVPHPLMKSAVRIFPDRYVVEVFIPTEALHGFEPLSHPELAFNIHVRNFQQATDYFWSAPKEVMTQLRPSTWGTLVLEQAGPASDLAQTDGARLGE